MLLREWKLHRIRVSSPSPRATIRDNEHLSGPGVPSVLFVWLKRVGETGHDCAANRIGTFSLTTSYCVDYLDGKRPKPENIRTQINILEKQKKVIRE